MADRADLIARLRARAAREDTSDMVGVEVLPGPIIYLDADRDLDREAADALSRPVTGDLLWAARAALDDTSTLNQQQLQPGL